MPEKTKEELQSRAQLIRVFESACQIEHPTPMELAFREATAKAIASEFGYRELRDKTIDGAATPGRVLTRVPSTK
jgi:hypothetical protein